MGRRSDHTREEQRDLILEAGRKIIEKEGLRGLTLRRIARDIGYTAGSLYNVFEDLDAITVEINCQTLDDLFERFLEVPKSQSPKRSLERLADVYVAFITENKYRWNALFEHQLPDGRRLPEHYQMRVYRLIDFIKEPISPLFSTRMKSEPEQSARVLWSSVYGICLLESQNKLPENVSARSIIQTLIDVYLKGVGTPAK